MGSCVLLVFLGEIITFALYGQERIKNSNWACSSTECFFREGRLMDESVCIGQKVILGKNVKFSKFINIYGCEIGDETKIGAFVEIQKNAKVGRRCKISSHTFICEGVTIGDNVFVGHNVTFVNDSYPKATTLSGAIQTDEDWKVESTLVKNGASIGSGATILSNLVIGEGALVGAGSVVTKDVPPYCVVAGNPARVVKQLPRVKEGE
jgi:UDP-2-acetamido-3-amino-2,3-dideoxy-glucuronate N-acetyltransferase